MEDWSCRKPHPGRDGVARAVKLRDGKSYSERVIQHLYTLELQCQERPRKNPELNAQAREFRLKRQSAENASAIIRELAEDESQEI